MIITAIVAVINKDNRRYGYLIWGLLFFFSMFRGIYVGRDTLNAMTALQEIDFLNMEIKLNHSRSLELLNNFIYICIQKGAPSRLIIYFYSIFTFIPLLLASNRYKINLSILMFFYLTCGPYIYSFNIARQFAALSILTLGISYIHEDDVKQSFKFFPLCLLAASIHFSCIIFVVLYFLRYLKINKNVAITVMVVSLLISLFNLYGLSSLIQMVNIGSYQTSYEDYIYEEETHTFGGVIVNIVQTLLFSYFVYTCKNDKQIMTLLPVSASLYILSSSLGSEVHRAFFIFMVLIIFMTSKSFTYYAKDKTIMLAYSVLTIYMFYKSILDDYYLMFFE